jgi:hypothetical protein
MLNRECIYAAPVGGAIQSPNDLNFSEPLKQHHEVEENSSNGVLLSSASNPGQQFTPVPRHQPRLGSTQELLPEINIDHMELLIHLTIDKNITFLSLGDEAFTSPTSSSLALKTGLKSPYLLHELLAISALHLASLSPAQSDFYLSQAITLQSRALSLFNFECEAINDSNCVAVLLFSSFLGHHLLADTLAKRESDGLGAFMANYIRCIEIHRGIHTIAMTAWPQLMESELEPVISASSRFTSRSPKGSDCNYIIALVDNSEALNGEDKGACRLMIRHLQVGFDAAARETQQGYKHYMVYTWLMLASPAFVDLLSQKIPEALIILAYYSILLHLGRGMWQIGDSGVHVLK